MKGNEMGFGVENVRGTVIGPITYLATLHSPRGEEICRTSVESRLEAQEWGKQMREKKLSEINDDLKGRFGEELGGRYAENHIKWLGWDGEWELRFFD